MGRWYFASAAQSCVIDTTPRMRFRRRSSCWRDRRVRSGVPRPWPVGCTGSPAGLPVTFAPRAAVETGIGVSHYQQAKPPWIAARGHITERFTRTWIKRHGTWQCVAYQTMVTERAEDPVAGKTPPPGKDD
jgi:hypothetical protein